MVSVGPPPKEYNNYMYRYPRVLIQQLSIATPRKKMQLTSKTCKWKKRNNQKDQQQTARIAILDHTLLSVMLKVVIMTRINTTVIQVKVSHPI